MAEEQESTEEEQQQEGKVVELPGTIGGFTIQDAVSFEENINFMVYGDWGVGKTVLCGSASAVKEMSPVLFVDIEGGHRPLKKFYPECKVAVVKETERRPFGWERLQKLYDSLYTGNHPFKTVVIDSITEAQVLSMNFLMNEADRKKDSDDFDKDSPGIKQWNQNTNQMRRFIRGFRDLPMNVLFTALANSEEDKAGRVHNSVMLPNKQSKEIPGLVDVVTYMYTEKRGKIIGDRKLMCKATGTTPAKDRTDTLPQIVEGDYLNMEFIYGVMTGQREVPQEERKEEQPRSAKKAAKAK